MSKLQPIHPGEILREEFIRPLGLNPNKLAIELRVPPPTVYDIVKEERGISPEMALRLARFFRTTEEFWVNLQANYDLRIARRKEASKVKKDVRPMPAACARAT